MDIVEIIKNHKSVSNFSSREIEPEKIDRIVKSVEFSPLGSDNIPLKTLVVTKPAKKRKIRLAAEQVEKAYASGAIENVGDHSDWHRPFLEEAPSLIIVCSLNGQPYHAASTWLSLGSLLRVIANEGLGARCYAPSMPTFLRKVIDIPAKFMPIAVVPIGYPADDLFVQTDAKQEQLFKNLFSGRFNWQKS